MAYLDTAASSQKPAVVIDRISRYLSHEHANIHRGAYALSARATESYEAVREKIAAFLNAPSPRCIVYTRGTTEAINLVAYSYGELIKPGESVLVSVLEHHSNIVPWQLLAKRRGVKLEFFDIHPDASLNLEDFEAKLKALRPRLVSVTQLSNAFGSVTPLNQIIALAKAHGCKVLVDAAQSISHMPIDVQNLGADFLAFSGHKLYGPTGVGALYAREELLDEMPPFQGGGDMIRRVTVEGSEWADYPQKFEAGTPAIAEVIGLGAAIDFVMKVGLSAISKHEERLFEIAWKRMNGEAGVKTFGPATTGGAQASIIPFSVEGVHPHDMATIADTLNVQMRAGHHCAMPALKRLGLQATARVSFGAYSVEQDIDALIEAIRTARKIFAGG
jgi:cysteine desulfurase/selenocysteine lyase